MIKLKRVYEAYSKDDGFRILVDRLWPRGVSKADAQLDLWLKEIAPSTELRKWFNHDVKKWPEFKKKYLDELTNKPDLVKQLKSLTKEYKTVTLLFGAKDTEHNEAKVLVDLI